MSTSIIEPGTRLAGRYRLEERVSEAGGSTLWKAIDEILARPVAARTFDPDVPNANAVVTAARAASRLTDPRLTQVFDADDSGESAYVVSEWASGETLEDMLADRGPLEPGRAATLLHEAAEALAAAHAADLAHLRLTPRDLLWTTGGTVKLLGIAIDAVLADSETADPAAEDTRGIGRMLYAAITAHWPGDPELSSLPPAPLGDDGQVLPPRRLRAGVPQALDHLVCRALGVGLAEGQEPLSTPAELAKALTGVPRTPLPLFTGLDGSPPPAVLPRSAQHQDQRGGRVPDPRQSPRPHHQPAAQTMHSRQAAPGDMPTQHTVRPTAPAGPAMPPSHRARPAGGGISRPLIAVGAAAVTVIVGVGAWQLGKGEGSGKQTATPPAARSSSAPAQTMRELQVVGAQGFDPTRPDRPDTSAVRGAQFVIDKNSKTEWHSQSYRSQAFGNLKDGLGVLLDMGQPVKVGKVKVTTPGNGGGTLQIRVGSSQDLNALDVVGRTITTSGTSEISTSGAKSARFVLLWFTRLPQNLKAIISNASVYGTN